MGLEPLPRQLEHVATNRSRNHHSNHLGPWMDGMVVATSGCSESFIVFIAFYNACQSQLAIPWSLLLYIARSLHLVKSLFSCFYIRLAPCGILLNLSL